MNIQTTKKVNRDHEKNNRIHIQLTSEFAIDFDNDQRDYLVPRCNLQDVGEFASLAGEIERIACLPLNPGRFYVSFRSRKGRRWVMISPLTAIAKLHYFLPHIEKDSIVSGYLDYALELGQVGSDENGRIVAKVPSFESFLGSIG